MTTSTTEPTQARHSKTLTGSPALDCWERDADAVCEKHGAFVGKERHLMGRTIKPICPQCESEHKAEREADELRKAQERKEARIRFLLGRSGIPDRFMTRTFDNYRAENDGQKRALQVAKAYAERFEDRMQHGGGLLFCGKPGTGKTHLAAAIANNVIASGRTVLFSSVIRAVRSVKDTYRREAEITEQQAIDALVMPDLLILDEVGVQFGSDTEKMIMFEVLNGRYEAVRPTIVMSNLTETEITDYLGSRVVDRLKEGGGVLVAFDWSSYRGKVHKDQELPGRDVRAVDWSR